MEKVKSGQPLSDGLTAGNWNEIVDTVHFIKERKMNLESRNGFRATDSGVVEVKLTNGSTLPMGGCVALKSLVITPDNSADVNDFKYSSPVFSGGTVSSSSEPFAILLEPGNPGECAKAMVCGVAITRINIRNSSHRYAEPVVGASSGDIQSSDEGSVRILWKAGSSGSQWCVVQIGGGAASSDLPCLAQIGGGSAQNGYSVTLYANGRESSFTGSGQLFLPEVAVDGNLPSGSWVIAHPTLMAITGGSDT